MKGIRSCFHWLSPGGFFMTPAPSENGPGTWKTSRSRNLRFSLLVLLLFAAVAGCQKLVTEKPAAPGVMEPEVFLRGTEDALKRQDNAGAITLYEGFLEAYPDHPMAEQAALQLAGLYVETLDSSRAYALLREWLAKYPQSKQRARARFYLGICLLRMDKPKEALAVFHTLTDDPDAAPFHLQVCVYLGESYLKLQQLLPALTWYLRYDAGVKEESEKRVVERKLIGMTSQGWEETVLQRALTLFPEGFAADAIRFGIALSYFRSGRVRLAEETLVKMSARHLEDSLTPHIQGLLSRISERERPRVCTIGCLIPLSGKYERFGTGVLDALLLGSRAFSTSGSPGLAIRLLIRDTQSDPAVGVRQLKDLASDPELAGVVGPLTAEVAQACAQEAQVLGIPLVVLTQKEAVAKVGSFVFQNGLTIRQQVETLVDYAMVHLGVIRFGILYPNDAYGTQARDRFQEKVTEMGGEVVSSVPYGGNETDFQDEIRLLVGESYWRGIKERERKQGFRPTLEEDDQQEETASGVSSGAGSSGLPFEALLIPDQYRKVALIAPHLALFDLSGILLLGTNAWNSPRLVESAGDYVRGSVFVDGFFAESSVPFVRDFVQEYRTTFQRDPGLLEAEALDSLRMLETAFDQAEPKNRTGVRDALSSMRDYPGLSGYTSFDGNGCAKKLLYLLSVQDNRIEQVY